MGRKNKYDTHVAPYLREIAEMYGTMTEAQIAKKLGVSVASFEKYKLEHPELVESLREGKDALIKELRESLKKKAKGFHYTEKKKIVRVINGQKTQIVEEYERYSPPDTGAIHLLLKNIDESWRNDDQATMDLKREKIELEKQKADSENW